VVSHDRYFLESVATEMAELSRAYPDGLFRVHGNYSAFLEKKSQYLEAQAKRQEALENRVRIELEWLRRGPKARATKAKRASARRTRRSENWRRSGPEGASKPRISISRRRTAGPSGSFN